MSKKKDIFEVPYGETKVLLHTCCAPCSSAIIEHLMKHGVTPVIYYCNPNIYPREEYEIRKNECTRYAESLGLEIVDADYDHENWLEAVKGLETEPERGGRCLKCFKLRLLRTAEYAVAHGFRVITSTLASSRWKSLDQINEAGQWACSQIADRHFSTTHPLPVDTPTPAEHPVSVDTLHESAPLSTEHPLLVDTPHESAPIPAEYLLSMDTPHESPSILAECPLPVDETGDGEIRTPVYWPYNWKKGGLQERRLQIIKEYNFYNQLYCGCEFSLRKP